ncbi:MAG TPA: peroxiredoxin-like family protein [bacterium]|nr:peroxiredoxin-like family protein [bacterium]
MFCRQEVARLAPRLPEFRAVGAEMIFIGNGSARQAARFREEQGIRDLPLFTDPKKKTYDAFGMTRGVTRVIGPGVLLRGLKTLKNGFRQGATQGDPFQNGGIVVVDAKGNETFRFVQQAAGEFVEPEKILEEVSAAAAAAAKKNARR